MYRFPSPLARRLPTAPEQYAATGAQALNSILSSCKFRTLSNGGRPAPQR